MSYPSEQTVPRQRRRPVSPAPEQQNASQPGNPYTNTSAGYPSAQATTTVRNGYPGTYPVYTPQNNIPTDAYPQANGFYGNPAGYGGYSQAYPTAYPPQTANGYHVSAAQPYSSVYQANTAQPQAAAASAAQPYPSAYQANTAPPQAAAASAAQPYSSAYQANTAQPQVPVMSESTNTRGRYTQVVAANHPQYKRTPTAKAAETRKPKPASKGKRGGEKKTGLPLWAKLSLAAVALLGIWLGVNQIYQSMLEAQVSVIDETAEHPAVFASNVYIDDIPLSGMTAVEGYQAALKNLQSRYATWSVRLLHGGMYWDITPGTIQLQTDLATQLDAAWQIGRNGKVAERKKVLDGLKTAPVYLYSEVSYTTEPIQQLLTDIAAQVYREPVNATVSDFTGENIYQPFVYTDEAYGVLLDTETVKNQILECVIHMQSAEIELTTQPIAPSVTKADLIALRAQRARATTPIAANSTDNRNANISLSLSRINGIVLKPNERLSFNKVVGMRTAANGFLTALEYAYGELRDGIGGGVCQASTTVYQAAVLAGLEIVKRTAHSDEISYAQLGQDATVMYTRDREIDLVIRNNTDHEIFILSGVMTDPNNAKRLITYCYIYGESLGTVKYELESILMQTLRAPTEPEYRKDTSGTYVMYVDETYTISKKRDGYVYDTYLIQKDNGVEVSRKLLSQDTYKARPTIIYVGTRQR